MARIARSVQPLYQTRGRPIRWPIRMTNPDGTALDLTGAVAVVTLSARGTDQTLTVGPLGTNGIVLATGSEVQSASLVLGNLNEMRLSLTDSQGEPTDYVWPVVGEDL